MNTTICAIATSLTPSGIGIIRMSGEQSKEIAEKIFVNKDHKPIKLSESHRMIHGFIFDNKKNEILDEVMLVYMKAPKSYTTEDVVEIQTHGNQIILQGILELLLQNGATLAQPGEFTKRAFLNGRIDLSQAESVADLIGAKSVYAKKAALQGLSGDITREVKTIRAQILEEQAYIEAALDDPEHISLDGFGEKLKMQTTQHLSRLQKIIDTAKNSKIITQGINTCILGAPNAGKSSLLNLLLGENRAIVTDIAGTTRDTIRESINFDGITLNIFDTAGIRDEDNVNLVEKIGIDKAKDTAENADLIIYMKDIKKCTVKSVQCTVQEDIDILSPFADKPIIVLLNKIDLIDEKTPTSFFEEPLPIIPFSTLTHEGLDELLSTIKQLFLTNQIDFNTELVVTNTRQLNCFSNALKSLENVIISIDNNVSEDFLTIDLKDAYSELSFIIGEEVRDDLVDEIFSKFCMGK